MNISKEFLESLVGIDRESAFDLCSKNNYIVRVTREDSVRYIVTMDLRFDRINLEFDNGLVTSCNVG